MTVIIDRLWRSRGHGVNGVFSVFNGDFAVGGHPVTDAKVKGPRGGNSTLSWFALTAPAASVVSSVPAGTVRAPGRDGGGAAVQQQVRAPGAVRLSR